MRLPVAAATALIAAGCTVQSPSKQDGVVVVAGTDKAAAAAPAPSPAPVITPPAPAAASKPIEAAVPVQAELATLAVEQDVGVLIAGEKARDPFRTADVDFGAVEEGSTIS